MFVCLFFPESYIKLLIEKENLEKEKKEAMEEILTQVVHAYDKFNVHSRENHAEGLKSLTDNILDVYRALLVTVRRNSGLPYIKKS